MFILVDGFDQQLTGEAEGCQVLRLPRRPPSAGWDDARWRMLTGFANALLERFDVVVLNDVDELVVLDPAAGGSLAEALAEARDLGVITPFAIEVVQRVDLEPDPLVAGEPVLGQRRYGRVHASYCKPCIIARPVRWSLGGHYSDFPQLNLSDKLFLFHLRAMDAGLLRARQAARHAMVTDAEGRPVAGVAGGGWARDGAGTDQFLRSFTTTAPEVTDFTFGWQRERIRKSWRCDRSTGLWVHDRLHNRRSYAIPERFFGII
ncbi:MAG: hypothetical protein Q27BPR15_09285 [Rhodobacter sp. CACIA14H1]|nr:MAG: hypothetical protein Q27BPR15_09285 [Rhodobacter sp. CACIA14H1]